MVAGVYKPQTLPPPATSATVDGYHFRMLKIVPSPLRAIQSSLMTVTHSERSSYSLATVRASA